MNFTGKERIWHPTRLQCRNEETTYHHIQLTITVRHSGETNTRHVCGVLEDCLTEQESTYTQNLTGATNRNSLLS